jgi:hypothetical protein
VKNDFYKEFPLESVLNDLSERKKCTEVKTICSEETTTIDLIFIAVNGIYFEERLIREFLYFRVILCEILQKFKSLLLIFFLIFIYQNCSSRN